MCVSKNVCFWVVGRWVASLISYLLLQGHTIESLWLPFNHMRVISYVKHVGHQATLFPPMFLNHPVTMGGDFGPVAKSTPLWDLGKS